MSWGGLHALGPMGKEFGREWTARVRDALQRDEIQENLAAHRTVIRERASDWVLVEWNVDVERRNGRRLVR